MRERSRRERLRIPALSALAVAARVAAACAACVAPAHATPLALPSDSGERIFDSEHFADAVLASGLGGLSFTFQGPFPAELNSLDLGAAILGPDLGNGVGISKDDWLTLGFARPGPALAIWEAGDLLETGETHLEASVDGGATFSASVLYRPAPVASDPRPSGYQTNFQMLLASDFGLVPDARIDALRITVRGADAAFVHTDILAVVVVPEPGSLALLGPAILTLALARWTRRRRIDAAPRR